MESHIKILILNKHILIFTHDSFISQDILFAMVLQSQDLLLSQMILQLMFFYLSSTFACVTLFLSL